MRMRCTPVDFNVLNRRGNRARLGHL
uniref:Uncharacterized protein n=1 Tax=Anguilla anguilla TaxID=7936 RepID=A0A0E9S4I6_ANGAN